MTIPDLIEPITGWRAWYLGGGADGLTLFSAIHEQHRWPAGLAVEARCARGHPAPADDCECGVYASLSEEDALAYVPLRAWLFPARARANAILGRVALWGKVRQGPAGWRAQFAYPDHLFIPQCFVLGPAKTAKTLSALYGIPADVVPALGFAIAKAA